MRLSVLFAAAMLPAIACASVYTDEAAFVADAAGGYYQEDFALYVYGGAVESSYGPVNGYAWLAGAAGGLYGTTGALSTNDWADALQITFTGAPVTWVGGIFRSTAADGSIISQDFVITTSNGDNITANGTQFFGLTSTTPFTWLRVDGIDSPAYNYPDIDRLYVGTAVPEPTSLLSVSSAASLLLLRKRRRKIA